MDQLEPMELPVHVLTSDMVDAAAMAPEPPTSAETHPAEADLIAAVAAIKARGNEHMIVRKTREQAAALVVHHDP